MPLIKGCVRETYNNMLNNQWQTSYKYAKKGENILKFNNHYSQQRVAFVIYVDFKAITKKVQGCRPNNNKSYTEAYQTHKDCGYGYKVYVAIMISTQSLLRCIGERMLYIGF